ncbi:MAG TPA: cytochrome oxidase subunit III, partial [Bacteroidia bacterium]|nr:cytochrome oxidase subunit III [Bacteroidia bacterium]
MSTATEAKSKSIWGGGISPFNVSWGKMFMWFFLVSDAFTFSTLLVAYGTMRHRFTDIWPAPGDVFTHFPFIHGHVPLAYVGLMTFILIISSVTMVLAVDAGHQRNH